MESINERNNALREWLSIHCKFQSFSLYPLPHDASFRRYFRVQHQATSFIAMDAPPAQEQCFPYIAISNALRQLGLKTPEIIQADLAQGFLLLTDFGDVTYLKALHSSNANKYYHKAISALLNLQTCQSIPELNLPYFDKAFMLKEWQWHKEWFLDKLLHLPFDDVRKLDDEYDFMSDAIAKQPQVFMHRDYHSANLMVLQNDDVGILDFQDAFIKGPITYDLASLLRDCYIDWPEECVQQWVGFCFQELKKQDKLPGISLNEFVYWFDLMSIQRHLKALLTFARKKIRDHHDHYLKHVPRTLNYLLRTTKLYRETKQLNQFLQQRILPAWYEEILCVQ